MSSNGCELTAVLFSTMAVARHLTNRVVLVENDNITTKAYIDHMDGQSRYLSAIVHCLGHVAHQHSIHLLVVHRPRVINQHAGKLSRWKYDSTDLQLDPALFC